MEDIVAECRICLSSDTDTSKMISPCSCRGTSAFVHSHCLTKWVDTSGNKSCMTCKVELQGEYEMKSILSWRIPLTSNFVCCFIVSISFLALLCFSILSHIALYESKNDSLNHLFPLFIKALCLYGLWYCIPGAVSEFRKFNQTFMTVQEQNAVDV